MFIQMGLPSGKGDSLFFEKYRAGDGDGDGDHDDGRGWTTDEEKAVMRVLKVAYAFSGVLVILFFICLVYNALGSLKKCCARRGSKTKVDDDHQELHHPQDGNFVSSKG